MTPECALVKLSYLLGKYEDPFLVRKFMQKDLRGEYTIIATAFGIPRFQMQNHDFIHAVTEALSKQTSDQRILVERAIVPYLVFAAAAIDDKAEITHLLEIIPNLSLIINSPDFEGRTPLHIASACGNVSVIQYLLSIGSSVHLRDCYDCTPLDLALKSSHLDASEMLIEAGAHINPTFQNVCLFFEALNKSNLMLVKQYIDAGIDINAQLCGDKTALHYVFIYHLMLGNTSERFRNG